MTDSWTEEDEMEFYRLREKKGRYAFGFAKSNDLRIREIFNSRQVVFDGRRLSPEEEIMRRESIDSRKLSSKLGRAVHKYGITREMAIRLYNYPCQICGSWKNICIGHSHKTGKVRGSLCSKHNTIVGVLEQLSDGDPYIVTMAVSWFLLDSPVSARVI